MAVHAAEPSPRHIPLLPANLLLWLPVTPTLESLNCGGASAPRHASQVHKAPGRRVDVCGTGTALDYAEAGHRRRVVWGWIDAVPSAKLMLAGLSEQNRFALAFRVHNMKADAGRRKKIETFVATLARGETVYPQKKRRA